jgi:VWFA-related protein
MIRFAASIVPVLLLALAVPAGATILPERTGPEPGTPHSTAQAAGQTTDPAEDDGFTLRVGVQEVNVLFTVTDRNGRLIDGLGPDDFIVEEDGDEQEILYFARENELPLTLALLIDTSPSVREVFAEEKQTARRFLESILRPQDLALVMSFDRSVTLMQDFTESPRILGDAIDDLEVGSGTSVFDAVYLASEERLQEEAGRKAIILISDGEDTTSRVSRTEALISAHLADSIIYSISNSLPGRGGFFGGGRRTGDIGTLRHLSEETGGAVFELDRRDDFAAIFESIAAELRSQYSLAYVSTNSEQNGDYREIRIRPRNRDYRVRARKGYYAPTPDN